MWPLDGSLVFDRHKLKSQRSNQPSRMYSLSNAGSRQTYAPRMCRTVAVYPMLIPLQSHALRLEDLLGENDADNPLLTYEHNHRQY